MGNGERAFLACALLLALAIALWDDSDNAPLPVVVAPQPAEPEEPAPTVRRVRVAYTDDNGRRWTFGPSVSRDALRRLRKGRTNAA